MQLAVSQGGVIRSHDVAETFQIPRRTAHRWLVQCTEDGKLIPVRKGQRITSYRVAGYGIDSNG